MSRGTTARRKRSARRATQGVGKALSRTDIARSTEQVIDILDDCLEADTALAAASDSTSLPGLSPERQALAAVEEALALGQAEPLELSGDVAQFTDDLAEAVVPLAAGECSCGHMAAQHDGGTGACSMAGCDCAAFEQAPAEASGAVEAAEVAFPEEHLPHVEMPAPHPSPTAPPQVVPSGTVKRWRCIACPEGKMTEDGRAFAPGSIEWREPPLSLSAMLMTAEGHDGAVVAGRIDRIWRAGDLIMEEGVFDESEFGQEIARMVDDRTLRGVSVDLAIKKYEVGPVSDYFDADGNWIPEESRPAAAEGSEPSLVDLLFGPEEPEVFVVTKAVIGMTTVVPFPAFADAEISLVADARCLRVDGRVTSQGGFTIVADSRRRETLVAAAAPVQPPASWFDDPSLEELTPLTVTDDGRVYGHAAAWGTCHIGIPEVCTTAPRSNTGYAHFHLKEVVCEDGSRVACGTITMDTSHAGRTLGSDSAAAHYEHTGLAVADVACGEDEHGIWVAGAVRPDVPEEKVRAFRGSAPSGDWRNVEGNLELIGLLAVNVPGFPVQRPRALVASGEDGTVVLTLTAAGVHYGSPLTPVELEQIKALAEVASGTFSEILARVRYTSSEGIPLAEADVEAVAAAEEAALADLVTFAGSPLPSEV